MRSKNNISDSIPCRVVGEYRTPQIKALAKDIKKGNKDTIRMAAEAMTPLVPKGAVLVPIPSHTGKAIETLSLAHEIATLTGGQVYNCLAGCARESSYELKHHGVVLTSDKMGFELVKERPDGNNVFLVDNVIASGNTALAALNLIPGATVLALASDAQAIGRKPEIVIEQSIINNEIHTDLMNMNNKQGVILIFSQGTTVAADFYRNEVQKEKIWRSWIDVASAKSIKENKNFTR